MDCVRYWRRVRLIGDNAKEICDSKTLLTGTPKKTKSSRNCINRKIVINNNRYETVDKFKYIGVMFTNDSRIKVETCARIKTETG